MPRETAAHQPLCADIDGFSLHAAVRVEAHDRKRLEQLYRTITRPALSDERVQLNAAGEVELKLKTPWRDGTTHRVMSPLQFMQRVAALLPRPRLHLIRFHEVLAPNARLRSLVVPQGPEVHEQATEVAVASRCEAEAVAARPHRIGWARLLKRMFDIDMERCPNCGAGELKSIAAILERPVIEKILTHLGLDPPPPPKGRARGAEQDFSASVSPTVANPTSQAATPRAAGAAGCARLRAMAAQGRKKKPRRRVNPAVEAATRPRTASRAGGTRPTRGHRHPTLTLHAAASAASAASGSPGSLQACRHAWLVGTPC